VSIGQCDKIIVKSIEKSAPFMDLTLSYMNMTVVQFVCCRGISTVIYCPGGLNISTRYIHHVFTSLFKERETSTSTADLKDMQDLQIMTACSERISVRV
jgi:hypothetical protein